MILLLFPAAITIHNLEEALWLPGWSQKVGKYHRPVTPGVFYFAVTVITMMACSITILYMQNPQNRVLEFCFIGFLGSMVVNTLFPHVAATVLTKSYCPGTLSGLLVLTPTCLFLLSRIIRREAVSIGFAAGATLGVGVLLIALLPLLFKLGESFPGQSSEKVER